MADKTRKTYEWSDCVRDLALMSSLTIREAFDLLWELERSDDPWVPWDLMPSLGKLFEELGKGNYKGVGYRLQELMHQAAHPDKRPYGE